MDTVTVQPVKGAGNKVAPAADAISQHSSSSSSSSDSDDDNVKKRIKQAAELAKKYGPVVKYCSILFACCGLSCDCCLDQGIAAVADIDVDAAAAGVKKVGKLAVVGSIKAKKVWNKMKSKKETEQGELTTEVPTPGEQVEMERI
ncbi:hypothetical protein ScPMuIL_012610 [Solemya velum]